MGSRDKRKLSIQPSESEAKVTKRKENFSSDEVELLIKLVHTHRKIVNNNNGDTKFRAHQAVIWRQIKDAVNEVGGNDREPAECKEKFRKTRDKVKGKGKYAYYISWIQKIYFKYD